MENQIIINGQKYNVPDSVVASIEKLIDGCVDVFDDNLPEGGFYYYINPSGKVERSIYEQYPFDKHKEFASVGNFCLDEKILHYRALAENLSRLLWRYSLQHGGSMNWAAGIHSYIFYDSTSKCFGVSDNMSVFRIGDVPFVNRKIAEEAIDKVVMPFISKHPEFKTYFMCQ